MKKNAVCCLAGPAGVGKTEAVRLLTTELKYEAIIYSAEDCNGVNEWQEHVEPNLAFRSRTFLSCPSNNSLNPTNSLNPIFNSRKRIIIIEGIELLHSSIIAHLKKIYDKKCKKEWNPLLLIGNTFPEASLKTLSPQLTTFINFYPLLESDLNTLYNVVVTSNLGLPFLRIVDPSARQDFLQSCCGDARYLVNRIEWISFNPHLSFQNTKRSTDYNIYDQVKELLYPIATSKDKDKEEKDKEDKEKEECDQDAMDVDMLLPFIHENCWDALKMHSHPPDEKKTLQAMVELSDQFSLADCLETNRLQSTNRELLHYIAIKSAIQFCHVPDRISIWDKRPGTIRYPTSISSFTQKKPTNMNYNI